MGFYQKNVCQGIIDKALEYGYTAEIFASMDGENLGDYSLGEESILTLPNFDDLSGVIFASETYPNEQLKDQIYSLLKEKCHCPIIEIAVYKQQFPSVSLENNHPFFPAITNFSVILLLFLKLPYALIILLMFFLGSKVPKYNM